jgi:hypothetical protein
MSGKTGVLPSLLCKYHLEDIFNADECGFFFSLFPIKTYVSKGESCHEGKKHKDKIPVPVCAHRMDLKRCHCW